MIAVRQHDLPALMEAYAEDAVAVSPVFGEVKGRHAIAEMFEAMFKTMPQPGTTVSDLLVDGDRIAILGTVQATDRFGWFGLPATGASITYRLVLLMTVADGKIVRDERIYDSAGVLERLEKFRLDKELRTAADVQRLLLSRKSHASAWSESAGNSLPCRAIGGDFFEFLDLSGGDVGIVMGDVAGKGPAAALLAAMLQGMFAVEASEGGGPAATLARVNRRLAARHLEPRYATLIYAVLSSNGQFVYSNGGHNPPVLVTRDGIRRLAVGGSIVGPFADAAFEEETLRLRSSDTVVMFTDGVTEATSEAGEEFGEGRLFACLSSQAGVSPEALMTRILSTVREFCGRADQTDDVTVSVTRVR
jgi:serine phosphatase RsbU (regulator of sigma subunit)/ketosteroid isomerase-like protein